MWKIIIGVIIVLILLLFYFGNNTNINTTKKCVAGNTLYNVDKHNNCPEDTTEVYTCSSNNDCESGRCDEVCRINCTDSHGNQDTTAITHCNYGFYDIPWMHGSYTGDQPLALPYRSGDKVLQMIKPFYGDPNTNCSSSNSMKLTDDVDAGLDINISGSAQAYSTYFGDDPCYGRKKITTFDYRYVPDPSTT